MEHLLLLQQLGLLQNTLSLVQQDTAVVLVSLQVMVLRSHHLGVGVASAHSSAS